MSVNVEVAAALAAGSLHELRNLLAVVASSAYLAKQKQGEPAALAAQLDKLERQIDAARSLLERLLAVASGAPLELETVSAAALVAEVVRELEPSASVTVEVDVPAALELACDRALLARALANLVGNALQAVGAVGGGKVGVRAEALTSGVALTVSDDGPGFACAPFDGTSTKPGGVGLGLRLARAIAEAHGGTLVVVPRDRGATLSLTLP